MSDDKALLSHSTIEAEQRRLEGATPQSIQEYEAFIASNPDSSYAYLQYAAYLAERHTADEARSVLRRGLSLAASDEAVTEKERLNVMVGWLNLEHLVDTANLMNVLKGEEAQAFDEADLYMSFCGGIADTDSAIALSLMSELVTGQTARVKRHRANVKLWTTIIKMMFAASKYKDAGKMVVRAKKSLSAGATKRTLSKQCRANIKTIELLYARSLCKCGDSTRQREGIEEFERLVVDYKDRSDVWSQYLDIAEAKLADEAVMGLYERVLRTGSKDSVIYYKRYMKWAKEQGKNELIHKLLTEMQAFLNDQSSA
ncbi:hypothetical protein KIPB_000024 [Kipferlia bialata]|uniref:Suppressor of forked domain-containing protein n=1 Tax=Kipferlia bialata TaxID=797122 RepID=A0A9K3CLN2_9EUKA|nr:hypothetical protein KIPB_000024 [Kipferlia bialata]|eukprot:g24.t1